MFGKNVAYFRKLKKMSQRELAKRLGLSNTYISMIENDKTTPSEENKVLIAKELGVKVKDLENRDLDPYVELLDLLIKLTYSGKIFWENENLGNELDLNNLDFTTIVKDSEYNFAYKNKSQENEEYYALYASFPDSYQAETIYNKPKLEELKQAILLNSDITSPLHEGIADLKSLLDNEEDN